MKGQPELGMPTAPPPYPGEMPPQPGFNPPHGTAPQVMVAPPVTVVQVTPRFGPHPVQMHCPTCNATIVTSTKPTAGLLTYLIAGGLCFVGCIFGCCLIPFCVDSCQNVEHFCPNCNAYLGIYNRM